MGFKIASFWGQDKQSSLDLALIKHTDAQNKAHSHSGWADNFFLLSKPIRLCGDEDQRYGTSPKGIGTR